MTTSPRILIADDEAGITDVLASILEPQHYLVIRAYDGEECIQKARSSNFDLILLDVQMPKLSGYEVIKILKQIPHLKYTPVVFLSGHNISAQNIETGYLAGGTEYWTKPIQPDELEVRVRSVLRFSEAEKRLRELGESFTSMIVHDLRSPLSGIVGLTEILIEERSNLPSQYADMIDEIAKASKVMLNIVTDFLELTHLDAGDYRLTTFPCDIGNLIHVCLREHEKVQREKSITVQTNLRDLPMVSIDSDRMQRVFNILLENAEQFTPPNGAITINARHEKDALIIDVADTGEGIPEDKIPLLFDKMRITLAKSRRAGARTGLSLPIARGIIEAHGGKISVASKIGIGSTFTITLPLKSPLKIS